jgi:apolipoprotein N-acyltransferase
VGADLLVNVDARAASGAIYKSSVLVGPDGIRGSYAKTRLVPFGEYVPLRPLLGWATRHTKAASEDRGRGDGPVVLRTDSLAVGPLISFEALFSDLARRETQLGADLLAYQSATSTYQGSWAQPQLASMAAVHAVEVGHPAVHAGISGVSSAFDARGRELGWLPAASRGVMVVDVPLGSLTTGYQRFGNWVIGLALLIFTAWCARSARRS